MNGPEHYAEAERLIDEANHVGYTDPTRADGMLRAAHVHATLAHTAAALMRSGAVHEFFATADHWRRVTAATADTDTEGTTGS